MAIADICKPPDNGYFWPKAAAHNASVYDVVVLRTSGQFCQEILFTPLETVHHYCGGHAMCRDVIIGGSPFEATQKLRYQHKYAYQKIEDFMKSIARIVFVIGVFLAWVLPLAAVPFVNIMPYLFSSTFGERFLISLATTALLAVCWWFACDDGSRRSLVSPSRARKDALSLALGTVAVTCIPAILGANVLGIFVTGLKNQPVRYTLELVGITEKTRKQPRTRWVLACVRSEARFEVMLADKMLAVPAVQVGSRVTLSGRHNFVGTYVEQVAVTPHAEPTC